MNFEKLPKTLRGATVYFADQTNCHDFLVAIRWPNGLVCPRCGSDNVGKFVASRRLWNCKGCRKQFTAKVGTIFEDSPLGLEKWLPAVWQIVNAKNGISSCELGRALGVTQKTAWFMLHRIRLAMQDGSFDRMNGQVEADETFIGGSARFMHKAKRPGGTGAVGKVAVMGLLERNPEKRASRVRCKVVGTVRRKDLDPVVRQYVEKGAEVFTDALHSYARLADAYIHNVIDHAECYAKGHVHTNGLENFWSLLKRGLRGTYVSVEPFHLFRYLDEQAFRFNERKHEDGDRGRFLLAMSGIIGKGIRYAKLIGKDLKDGDSLPPTTGTWQAA
jgi:transposase-like protein